MQQVISNQPKQSGRESDDDGTVRQGSELLSLAIVGLRCVSGIADDNKSGTWH